MMVKDHGVLGGGGVMLRKIIGQSILEEKNDVLSIVKLVILFYIYVISFIDALRFALTF